MNSRDYETFFDMSLTGKVVVTIALMAMAIFTIIPWWI
jgi:hypothetical protein